MCMKEWPGGELLSMLNITVCGVGGFPMRFMGRMGSVCGNRSGRIGGSFLVIPYLSWKMAPKLDSDMTNGMGVGP
jgi:hypothetical protein